MAGGGGGRMKGSGPPLLENHNLSYVSLETFVRTPLEKQLDPLDPIASRGGLVWPSVK